MRRFDEVLTEAKTTQQLEVIRVSSESDGWLVSFTLCDERQRKVKGVRKIYQETTFTSVEDLIDELWCSPGLTDYDL